MRQHPVIVICAVSLMMAASVVVKGAQQVTPSAQPPSNAAARDGQSNLDNTFAILGKAAYGRAGHVIRAAAVLARNFFRDEHDAINALATIVIALFTWQLWRSTERLWAETQAAGVTATIAADAAKKSADASLVALRPWLSCNVEIAGPLIFTSAGDAQFDFRIIVKNAGHSPAMGVRLVQGLNLMSTKHEHSILMLLRIADHNRAMPPVGASILVPGGIPLGAAELGKVLFPEETYTFNVRIPIRRDEIEKACEDIKPDMNFWPELWGLVTYTYSLAAVRADTGFVCSIEKSLADGRRGGVLKLDEPGLVDHLRLSDHSLWSGFAT
jgi:hypothetical protein